MLEPSAMRAVGARGVGIHYREVGEGPAVVLIQGLALSGRFWFDVPEAVAAEGFRVLVPDNRGTGGSDRPRLPFRMADMADDVAAVLDHAGVERAVVAGISMGGMIAQHVALRHGARLAGLVLMATTPGLPHGRLPPRSTLRTLMKLPFVTRGSPEVARLLLPQDEVQNAGQHLSRWPAAFKHDPITARTFFLQLAAVASHSTGSRLRSLRCPTVVMHGREDVFVPPENSEILARRIPDAELEMLPRVAHAIPALDADAVRRAICRVSAR